MRAAAWQGVVSVAGPGILSGLDSSSYFRRLKQVDDRLDVDDMEGRFWRAGTLAEARELANLDRRFTFVQALPRSALFGETIANAVPAAAGDGIAIARLTNMFVTCFDGICDETQNLLPATVPYLDQLRSSIPRSVPQPPPTPHPVISLTHSIAATVAGLLVAAFRQRGHQLADLVLTTIREAYHRQLNTLRMLAPDPAENRARLSVATFAVSLAFAALFNGLSRAQAEALVRAATPIGELFGWIDDVVDMERDVARGIPNLAAGHLHAPATDPESLTIIAQETGRRWLNAQRAGEALRQTGILADEAFDGLLRDATWAWLGFPTVDGK